MRIHFISDERQNYSLGTYYEEWNYIARKSGCNIFRTTDFAEIQKIKHDDLIILSHSFVENILSKKRYLIFKKIRNTRVLKTLIYSDVLLKKIRSLECRKILLSRNDYKGFHEKVAISNYLRVSKFVTHTKSSIDIFKNLKSLHNEKFYLYQRLYALGIDAHKIIYQLNKLQRFPQFGISGMTGNLHINDKQQISRKLLWAKF